MFLIFIYLFIIIILVLTSYSVYMWSLKAPYSSKIDILLSKKGLINRDMVLIQS